MSAWTYVHGMLEVDTFAQTSAEAIFKVQTVIDHLPQITGSEGPARFTVVPRLGHNTSFNCDELEHRSNLLVRVSSYEKEYIFNDPQWMIEAPSSEWTSGLVNWKAVPTSDW